MRQVAQQSVMPSLHHEVPLVAGEEQVARPDRRGMFDQSIHGWFGVKPPDVDLQVGQGVISHDATPASFF